MPNKDTRLCSRHSGADLATLDVAAELEPVFAIGVSDADLDAMKTPLDLVQFFRAANPLVVALRSRVSPALGERSLAPLSVDEATAHLLLSVP